MILVTGKDTGLAAYIWENEITHIEETGKRYPSSRVFMKNQKLGFDFFLDVKESAKEIQRRIREEKLDPGCEVRGTEYG